MQRKIITLTVLLLLIAGVVTYAVSAAKYKNYKIIYLNNVSRYDEDRIAYQRFSEFLDTKRDNSLECLLVVRKKKMYLLKDGYDSIDKVKQRQSYYDMENKLFFPSSLFKNKMNGKPDFVKITNRRIELVTNSDEEFVAKNFGTFYKNIRDKFIKEHVKVFKKLMANRDESFLYVKSSPLPLLIYPGSKVSKQVQKFKTIAKAKTNDETVYYCEDADGDGITETFTVERKDGFNWGFKSGPNVIFIYKNNDKVIENLIGKLAHEAVHGTVTEEKDIIKSFPKEKDISDLIDFTMPEVKRYR